MGLQARFQVVPKVDQLLDARELDAFRTYPREVLVRHVQEEVDRLRQSLQAGTEAGLPASREEATQWVLLRLQRSLATLRTASIRRVLNATGVVLHTNLGRAPLSRQALEAVVDTAIGYSNLEYDLQQGERTSRMVHIESLVRQLTGAEAALAVNNNAAAVLLAIHTLGQAGVVVSRGEQVEIGDSFRLPEILSGAGVPIHEVGTTNRTSVEDYVRAATPGCVFLKVHRSNFTVHGYTREAALPELAAAAGRVGARVVYDLGSGSLTDFASHGLRGEPGVVEAIAGGADVVTLSGDKLLGGPQAGLLVGREAAVQQMRRNPLSRALRIDKLTLAALQATLLSYVENGAQDVPARRLILSTPDEIQQRADRLKDMLQGRVAAQVFVVASTASVGGGTFADVELPSVAVAVQPESMRATELLQQLRCGNPAVVARIKGDTVVLDQRCIADDEVEPLAQALQHALAGGGGVE